METSRQKEGMTMTKTEFEGQLDDLISKGRADGMAIEAVLAALEVATVRLEDESVVI
jgi:hypothetical protein